MKKKLLISLLFLSGFLHSQKFDDHLYIMQNGELYKVGRSVNPIRRAYNVNYETFGETKLLFIWPGLGRLERRVHELLAEYQVDFTYRDGSVSPEWFLVDDIREISRAVLNIWIEEQYKKLEEQNEH